MDRVVKTRRQQFNHIPSGESKFLDDSLHYVSPSRQGSSNTFYGAPRSTSEKRTEIIKIVPSRQRIMESPKSKKRRKNKATPKKSEDTPKAKFESITKTRKKLIMLSDDRLKEEPNLVINNETPLSMLNEDPYEEHKSSR